jgi:succinyl-CoA synthetase alpha subunit
MSVRARVIKSRYVDSVVLMRLAERLTQLDSVDDAAALMGTAANKTLLQEGGFVETAPAAEADDLIVAVKAASGTAADAALARVEELLEQRTASAASRSARTLEQALELDPDINLATISLPGEYAASEARHALERGLHVFLFSSNVPLDDEIALKTLAAERGLLCMGPDCGTALIAGKALGFGNAVRRGPVGIVAAAGSGLQAVTSYLDSFGVGVSHAIGCGGRDLSEAVGARTMRAGLEALLADDATEAILLLSKPPSPTVAADLQALAEAARKPVICCFLGESGPETLDAAARVVAAAVGPTPQPVALGLDDETIQALAARLSPTQHDLRGLYAGGTLAYEAQLVLRRRGLSASSNAPLRGAPAFEGDGHVVLDMGAEEFTRGRPHPMIDARERRARLLSEAADPSVAVVLLDFVLGFGAAADPVGDLADAIESARRQASDDGRELVMLAFVCGTAADPQDIDAQKQRLRDVGAFVLDTNAAAVESAARLLSAVEIVAPPATATAGGAR